MTAATLAACSSIFRFRISHRTKIKLKSFGMERTNQRKMHSSMKLRWKFEDEEEEEEGNNENCVNDERNFVR